MKREIEAAFEDIQGHLRDLGPYDLVVEVDVEDMRLIVAWAQKHGLRPDLQEGDRIKASKDLTHYWTQTPIPKGSEGVVYQVIKDSKFDDVRVVWDADPLEEKEPVYVMTKHLRRVFDE